MNTSRDLLDDLSMIGATIEPAGERLVLRAGATAIPAGLVNRIRDAKGDLMAILAADRDHAPEAQHHAAIPRSNQQPEGRTLKGHVIEWLNQHSAPSAPGRCAFVRE